MSLCEKCGTEIDAATGLCPVCDIVQIERKKADMKRKKTLVITFSVILVFIVVAVVASFSVKSVIDKAQLAAAVSESEHQREIEGYYQSLVGEYQGSYFNGADDAGLTLTVYEQEGEYYANFKFYNLPDTWVTPDGEYILKVTYNESTGQFDFTSYEWIVQPDNYVMIDLSGTLEGDTLSGASPTQFSVTRIYE